MLTYGNGRTLTKTYDQDYMIDSVASSASDGLKLDFGRDVMANITSASGTLGANPPDRQYVYDTLYRLTRVNDTSGAMLEDYNYNKTGDRTLKQFAGQAAQVYTYLSGTHRLGSVDGVSRSYDSNGNTTNRGDSITLAYNDQNRLYAAAIPANWTEYGYSGRGERVRKLQDNVGIPIADRYAYNESGQMLHNRKNETIAGSPVETQLDYLFIDAIPVAQTREKTLTYIETDHLGTPRVAANSATNAKEWSWDLLGKAFGENAPTTVAGGTDVQLRYPGQWVDAETGLNYNFYRDYEAATGRYVESDPLELQGGISTYAYTLGNSLGSSDPYGLDPGIPSPFWRPGQPLPLTNNGRIPPPIRWSGPLPWSGVDRFFSNRLVSICTKSFFKISASGRLIPNPVGGGLSLLLYSPELGCATLECHQEYLQPQPPRPPRPPFWSSRDYVDNTFGDRRNYDFDTRGITGSL